MSRRVGGALGVDRRLFGVWETLRTSLWFVPAILGLAGLIAAKALVTVDARVSFQETRLDGWLYAGSVAGARSILAALAGSTITVAGLVFSMTIVALTFASSQLGPRLLRNLRTDRVNQLVLGSFVGTFLYHLVVLSSLGPSEAQGSVPRLALTLSLVLATVGFGVLIYFLHHLARAMQTDNAIRDVRATLEGQIERLFADEDGPGGAPDEARYTQSIDAGRSGYVQGIDYEHLQDVAAEADVDLLCTCKPGDFVLSGRELMRATAPPGEACLEALRDGFVLGSERTDAQDPEFALRQLVEIALRALSPGINDPYTAVACVDQLAVALALLARHETPEWTRPTGEPRVWARGVTFEDALSTAWDPLREHGAAQTAVAARVVERLTDLAACAPGEARQAGARAHARAVLEAFERSSPLARDLAHVRSRMPPSPSEEDDR